MWHRTTLFAAFLVGQVALKVLADEPFDIPLRINMGGTATQDSRGRTWLGDGPGVGDILNIRPDDAGGTHTEENWLLQNFQPDSLDALGFDSTNPNDVYIFNTIRWDEAALPPDFLLEIPVPKNQYTVNLYFNEACCTGRHFKIEIQGILVDEDVSYLDYDVANPQLGRVGRLSFDGIAVGDDGLLRIGLLPCPPPDCPDAMDNNAIIDALEVISGPACDHFGLDFNCTFDQAADKVIGTWVRAANADGYRISKNGVNFLNLPGTASSFEDTSPRSGGPAATYVLQALDGGVPFSECRCFVKTRGCSKDLTCVVNQAGGEVALSWSPPAGISFSGFELRRNGTLIKTLPSTATTYEDTPPTRLVTYTLTTITAPPGQCGDLTCSGVVEGQPFEVPLRINMGGAATVDSKGHLWLGDGPGAGDPLNIRPDDASGTNWIESWCGVDFGKLRKLGFDPANDGDRYIFSTIRWDLGNDGIDFYVELPVPNNDDYLVNLYFNECCCPQRHFKIEMQGEIVDEDVSSSDYDPSPGFGKVGRLSFNHTVVSDGILRIGFLPCPECPGAGDTNAIVNAIEVVTNPCADPTFRVCPDNLSCSVNPVLGTVTGTWEPPLCFEVASYELRKNGQLLKTLAKDAVSFTDKLQERVGFYEVVPTVANGVEPCATLSCTAVRDTVPFSVPVRINMGGSSRIDSRGQLWVGDGPGAGDPLSIRVDDLGGANWIENWCFNASLSNADSMRSLGYNPSNPNDEYIFNTIRYDDGNEPTEFRLEIPIQNGTYLLNFYFTECCCPNRHFKIEVQGVVVDEDVSSADYSQVPLLGRTGRLSFDGIVVEDGILRIGFLPCFDPECLGGTDGNSIIDAIEVLAGGTTLHTCPRDLLCSLGLDGKVTGTWTAPENVTVTGYDLYRDGTKIGSLPAGATQFVDDRPPCHRIMLYEVAPLSDAPDFLCPGMRMRCNLLSPDCPFSAPLRINMGGVETIDSHGNTWLGDGPGAGDPLDIRPDDLSGTNTIESWCAVDANSLSNLGFDPTHLGDNYIFSTIRWDVGADGIDFRMEIPMEDGQYTVNLYFNECCCPARHFKIEIQDEILDEDVSFLDYDTADPAFGHVGRLTFEGIVVGDGILKIGLLPCVDCPGVQDTNAIVDALEVLGSVGPQPKFHRGDSDDNGQLQLTDAIRVLGFLFLGSVAPSCFDAADADDNGQLQLTDAIRILGYLFLGSVPPSPPGPPPANCGPDPGETHLGCQTYTHC